MTTPLIRSPAVEIPAGQLTTVLLSPLTLPSGRVVTDYTGFTLKLREDPLWPRAGAAEAARDAADPIKDGWAEVLTATGSLNADNVPAISFTMVSPAGTLRYAYDVWGTLAGGEVQLVQTRWVTCGARVV